MIDIVTDFWMNFKIAVFSVKSNLVIAKFQHFNETQCGREFICGRLGLIN